GELHDASPMDIATEQAPIMDTSGEPSIEDVTTDARPAPGPNGVLQYHRNPSRDGVYIEPAFTKAAAAQMHADPNFHATIEGPTYAQPLYFDAGPGGKDLVLVATEKNIVYALDANTGSTIWQRTFGVP